MQQQTREAPASSSHSAAARRSDWVQAQEERKRQQEERKQKALEVFLPDVAEAMGLSLKKAGKEYVGMFGADEYRFFESRSSDVWLATDKNGSEFMNPISFVQRLMGVAFPEAISYLVGDSTAKPVFRPAAAVVKHAPAVVVLSMPITAPDALKRCLAYCTEVRGISRETVEIAIDQRALTSSIRGPVFLGWDDESRLRFAETRYIKSFINDKGKEMNKLSAEGTNKSFVPMLLGVTSTVWIVEGGFDMLAAFDLCRKAGKPVPNVICSGGSRNYFKLLENPKVTTLLREASRVVIWHENEAKVSNQSTTDADHEKMAAHIDEWLGKKMCELHRPPVSAKDLAEWNKQI